MTVGAFLKSVSITFCFLYIWVKGITPATVTEPFNFSKINRIRVGKIFPHSRLWKAGQETEREDESTALWQTVWERSLSISPSLSLRFCLFQYLLLKSLMFRLFYDKLFQLFMTLLVKLEKNKNMKEKESQWFLPPPPSPTPSSTSRALRITPDYRLRLERTKSLLPIHQFIFSPEVNNSEWRPFWRQNAVHAYSRTFP